MRHLLILLTLLLCVGIARAYAQAPVCGNKSQGHAVCLDRPAQRIISLSPGATEQLFAIGAGRQLIATVDYSDYPAAASRLPSVGSSNQLDVERMIALKPDLVVAWTSGNSPAQLAQLEALGIRVIRLDPQRIQDVAASLRSLGELTGHTQQARRVALTFSQGMAALEKRYAHLTPVRTFYEVWDKPLITLNGQQLISQVISLCGGRNIFAQLTPLAPRISREAVLVANPDAIISGAAGGDDNHGLEPWRDWPQLKAARYHALFIIPPDLIQRPTPRLLQGATTMCQQLDSVRQHLAEAH